MELAPSVHVFSHAHPALLCTLQRVNDEAEKGDETDSPCSKSTGSSFAGAFAGGSSLKMIKEGLYIGDLSCMLSMVPFFCRGWMRGTSGVGTGTEMLFLKSQHHGHVALCKGLM